MPKPKWLYRRAMPNLPYLRLCLDEKDFEGVCRKLKLEKPWAVWVTPGAGATTHTMERDESFVCVVCIKAAGHTYEEVAALLVHEAVHVWQVYRDSVVGEKNPGHEFEAYCIQAISQELLVAYANQRT